MLLAAGDIANCGNDNDEATARLLDSLAGHVAALGDNAYNDGSAQNYAECYDPTWGRQRHGRRDDIRPDDTSAAQHPSHSYADGGTYTVSLTVTDDLGVSNTTSHDLTVNAAPAASFASSCLGTTCYFTDQSTDADGSVVAWSWNFGDGNSSTEQHPIHTYVVGGTYTVSLTVTDDAGATGAATETVVVSPSGITLGATGSKVKGLQKVDLSWSGAAGASVEIYRDGVHLATATNSGAYRDEVDARGKGTYVYQVCEVGATSCSNSETVAF